MRSRCGRGVANLVNCGAFGDSGSVWAHFAAYSSKKAKAMTHSLRMVRAAGVLIPLLSVVPAVTAATYTVDSVAALTSTYSSASDGDTIIVANSGSPYQLTAQLNLDKLVNVRAETDGAVTLIGAQNVQISNYFDCPPVPGYTVSSGRTDRSALPPYISDGYAFVLSGGGEFRGFQLQQGTGSNGGALHVQPQQGDLNISHIHIGGWVYNDCHGIVDFSKEGGWNFVSMLNCNFDSNVNSHYVRSPLRPRSQHASHCEHSACVAPTLILGLYSSSGCASAQNGVVVNYFGKSLPYLLIKDTSISSNQAAAMLISASFTVSDLAIRTVTLTLPACTCVALHHVACHAIIIRRRASEWSASTF